MSKVAIAIGAVVVLGGVAYAGTEVYLNREAEREVASFAESVSDQANFRYRSVRTSLWDRNARIEGIEITFPDLEEGLTIDQAQVETWDILNDPPTFGSVSLSGLRFDLDAETQEIVTALDYTDLSSDLSLSYTLSDREVDFAMQWRTAAVFGFSLDMQLLDLNLQAVDNFDPASLASVSISRLSMVYTDESLLPRALDYLAAESGVEVTEIKAEFSDALAELAEDYPGYAEAITAIQAFVANPSRLSVTIAPTEPVVPFSLILVDPNEWPSRLNLQVSAR